MFWYIYLILSIKGFDVLLKLIPEDVNVLGGYVEEEGGINVAVF